MPRAFTSLSRLSAVAALALCVAGPSPSFGQALTLDLAGADTSLPRPPFFANPYLSGIANVTNTGVAATLSERGGAFDSQAYTGAISGPVSVTHTDGVTIFAGLSGFGTGSNNLNSYTGTTTISSGTLRLGDGSNIGTLGSGPIVNNGLLQLVEGINYQSSTPVTLANPISGSGAVVQQGSGTVVLSGSNSYSGGTVVDGGTSQLLFGSATAVRGPASITLLNGGIAGTTYALEQAFLDGIAGQSSGVVALGADSANPLSFVALNLASVSLGAASGNCDSNNFCQTFNYSGALTPNGAAYNLGGGNAILNVQTSLADVTSTSTSLNHGGNGYTILSGTNTYSGGTTISSGVLQFASTTALPLVGSPTITIQPFATAAAGFALDQTFLSSVAPGSQGTVALAVDSASDLDFSNLPSVSLGAAPTTNPTYSGTITPNGNTYLLGGGRAGSGNGNLNVTSILTDGLGLVSRGLTVNASGFTQAIDVHLLNTNTFTGPTLVDGGSLWLGNGSTFGNIPTTSGVTVNNSSLNFNEPTALVFDRSISGNGNVAQYGPGTVTLTGPVGYTGATFIFDGTLALGPASSLATSSVVRLLNFNNNPAPPIFDISGAGSQTVQGLIGDATSAVNLGANRLTIGNPGAAFGTDPFNSATTPTFAGSIAGTGGVTFQGAGAFVLSGTNTYGGSTIVGAGTILTGGAANAFSPTSAVALSGSLDLGGYNQTVGSLAGAGLATNGGTAAAVLTTGGNGSSTTFGGTLADGAGAFGLIKTGAGTFALTGTNTYSGSTKIGGGTLSINNPNAIGTGTLQMADGTTLAFAGSGYTLANNIQFTGTTDPTFDSGPGTVAVSGRISGQAALQKNGTGTLVLLGDNTYAGNTLVNQGTLQVDGSIASSPVTTVAPSTTLSGSGFVGAILAQRGSVVAPGSASNLFGTLTAAGPVMLTTGSTLAINSSPLAASRLLTTGAATIANGGILQVSPGTAPYTVPVRLPILVAAQGLSGQFSTVNLTSPTLGLQPTVVYDGNDAYLQFGDNATNRASPDVQSSIAAAQRLARERFGSFVTLRMLSSILQGFTQQVNCSDCVTSFGSGGSFSAGVQGRKSLTEDLSVIGGFAYANYESGGVRVVSAPIFAGVIRYDMTELGAARPFFDVGGFVAPSQTTDFTRRYTFGNMDGGGSGRSSLTSSSVFARLGYDARLTPQDEAAAAVEFSRGWQRAGRYSEPSVAGSFSPDLANPYPIVSAGGTDSLNIVKAGGQWTHLWGERIETQLNFGVAHAFDTTSGISATLGGSTIATPIGDYTWAEYGARVGYRLVGSLVLDTFLYGTLGGRPINDTVHGGAGLRYAF